MTRTFEPPLLLARRKNQRDWGGGLQLRAASRFNRTNSPAYVKTRTEKLHALVGSEEIERT